MLGGYPPIREDFGGIGFQPVPAQAKACGYIYTYPHVPIFLQKTLPDTTAFTPVSKERNGNPVHPYPSALKLTLR